MSDIRLKQDDILEIEISDSGMEGEGVARYEDYTVFVPFSLKGERVRAKVKHVRKDGLVFTELKEILTPSKNRVKPPCNRFGRCGGCNLMHADYGTQLEIKYENLKRLLKKNAGVEAKVEEVIESPLQYGYRNKIQLPFGTVENRTVLGFYRENSHKVVSITKCFLHGDWAEKLIGIFLSYAEKFRLRAYDENTGKGQLKHLVARYIDGNISIVVVTDNAPLAHTDYLLKELSKVFGSFSLYQSKKPEMTNVIMGKSVIPIKETPFEIDVLGIKTEVNPYSFLQLNSDIRDKIYLRVIDEIMKKPNPVVIDAYAGVGILGAALNLRGAKVYNIEIVPEATRDANKLNEKNNLSSININGDTAVELPKLINRLRATDSTDLSNLNIILDPPRKGCDKRVIEAVNSINNEARLFYISCNPATLTRDLKLFTGFKIETVQPYDMFPNTSHLETLVILSKRANKE